MAESAKPSQDPDSQCCSCWTSAARRNRFPVLLLILLTSSPTVLGAAAFDLSRVGFVETRGRPGHEAVMPASTAEPTPGPADVEASFLGSVASASLAVLAEDGSVLAQYAMSGDATSVVPDFSAQVTVPSQPFQLQVTGQQLTGEAFDFLAPRLYQPTLVRIAFDEPTMLLRPGKHSLSGTVTNSGAPVTLSLSLADKHRYGVAITPATLPLATDEQAGFSATVIVPSLGPESMTVDLTATAVEPGIVSNSAYCQLLITRLGDLLSDDFESGTDGYWDGVAP
jgi:hypothetical protein